MAIGQTIKLLVDKLNTKYGAIGRIVHVHREGIYEVEFRDYFNKITVETVTSNEIEKA